MIQLTESEIYLKKLHVYAFHGIMPQERRVGGWYTISLSATADIAQAMISDDVADTINYATLSDIIHQEMNIPSQLLEHVVYRICQSIFRLFPTITSITIDLRKDTPPMPGNSDGAGVRVTFQNKK